MPSEHRVKVSLTDTKAFRRLVDFVYDVERLADDRVDLELRELVDALREDLAEMGGDMA